MEPDLSMSRMNGFQFVADLQPAKGQYCLKMMLEASLYQLYLHRQTIGHPSQNSHWSRECATERIMNTHYIIHVLYFALCWSPTSFLTAFNINIPYFMWKTTGKEGELDTVTADAENITLRVRRGTLHCQLKFHVLPVLHSYQKSKNDRYSVGRDSLSIIRSLEFPHGGDIPTVRYSTVILSPWRCSKSSASRSIGRVGATRDAGTVATQHQPTSRANLYIYI